MKPMTKDRNAAGVPAKWARHYQKLLDLRESLVADHAEQVSDATEPLEWGGNDNVDRATDEFDHDLTLGILSHEENNLFEVEAAIQRILDGTYAICEKTGEPIPEARLNVVPWTRYTRDALESIERENTDTRPRVGDIATFDGTPPGELPEDPESLIDEEPGGRGAIRSFPGDLGHRSRQNPTPET
jgi:DnaK suppressor protein